MPELPDVVVYVEKLRDREWRLRNLYWIVDKDGNKVRFSPNHTQRRLLASLAKRSKERKGMPSLGATDYVVSNRKQQTTAVRCGSKAE